MHCRATAAQLRRDEDEIRRRGARLVAIGTGDARYARAFIADEDIDFLVLLDEDGAAADAARVRRGGAWALVGPRSIGHGALAFARGHRQRKTGKRPTQLGATFVIAPGGTVLYEHLSRDVADRTPTGDVLDALDAAR